MALEPRFIWKIWGRAIRTQKTSLNKVEQEGRRASFLLKKTVFWPKHTRNTPEHARTKNILIDIEKTYLHTKNQPQIGPIRGSASHFFTKNQQLRKIPRNATEIVKTEFFIIYIEQSHRFSKLQPRIESNGPGKRVSEPYFDAYLDLHALKIKLPISKSTQRIRPVHIKVQTKFC